MPYITSVEQIGQREGELRGQRAMLRRLIQARFGTAPAFLERQIAAADQARLGELADRLAAAASLDELDAEPGMLE